MIWLSEPILLIFRDLMKIFCVALIMMLFACFTTGCDERQQKKQTILLDPKSEAVRIGVIGPMSESDEKWGKNGLDGIGAAMKYHGVTDKNGGVKLFVEDDQNTAVLAQKAFIKLVEDSKVVAILLLSNSEVALALEDLAKQYNVPVFALVATHPDIAGKDSYITQLIFDDKVQATVAALYMRDELLINTVAVIVDDQNPHSFSLAKQFIHIFSSTGGIPIEIAHHKNKQQFEPRLKSLQANEISFVYVPLDAEDFKAMAEILEHIDYHPTLMGSDGLEATLALNFPDILQMVDGMLATDSYSSDYGFTQYGQEIKQLFSESFDEQGTVIAAQGAEGVSILVSALNSCSQDVTSFCVHRMIRSVTDFVGLQSKVTIGQDGKAERPIYINRVDGGQLSGEVKVYYNSVIANINCIFSAKIFSSQSWSKTYPSDRLLIK
jgi:ABC-type branched-subunit amino acid transport system substrate-binding protein